MPYIHDPVAIHRRSIQWIRARLTGRYDMPVDILAVVARLVQACGMLSIARSIAWHDDIVVRAKKALAHGCTILSDAKMSAAGIHRPSLIAKNPIICLIDDPSVADEAKRRNETRSAIAVEHWRPHLAGSVVVIGNAPTALFRLLEIIERENIYPAAIFAFPVGFVGAAASKRKLIKSPLAVPYMTLAGRRGGSALAAASINAVTQDS